METAKECPKVEAFKVGPDQVTIQGNQVIIEARHPMAEWQVREYSRIPVYFREKKYFLREKGVAQKPFAMRYVLELWPEEDRQTSRIMLEYSEEVVTERENAIRGGHFEDVVKAALLLVFPFLGMLWSETKQKLARFGIVSRTVTGVSIMLTFGLVLLDGVFAKMLIIASLRSGKIVVGGMIRTFYGHDYLTIAGFSIGIVWLDCILFVLLVADVLIRYSQHLRDEDPFYGFLEWIFHRRKKLVPVQT